MRPQGPPGLTKARKSVLFSGTYAGASELQNAKGTGKNGSKWNINQIFYMGQFEVRLDKNFGQN